MSSDRVDRVAEAIRTNDEPVMTTSEIADIIGCSRRTVLNDLRVLERTGEVASKDVGARAVAWWHTTRVTEPGSAPPTPTRETSLTSPERDPSQQPVSQGGTDRQPFPATAGASPPEGDAVEYTDDASAETTSLPDPQATPADVQAAVDRLDLPGTAQKQQSRRDAVLAAYDYLRATGDATKREFIDVVYSEYPARYTSPDGWWNNISDALRDLAADLETIDVPDRGQSTWYYLEPERPDVTETDR